MTIVDRKKEIIINAAGKNMSPANIEARLKSAHALIGQAVAIGDRRPYNVALLVLDPEVAAGFEGDVEATVAEAVEKANAQLSRVEQIKRYKVLDEEWLPGGDELTPTMKLKRKPIAEKYAAEIEALYSSEPAPDASSPGQVPVSVVEAVRALAVDGGADALEDDALQRGGAERPWPSTPRCVVGFGRLLVVELRPDRRRRSSATAGRR